MHIRKIIPLIYPFICVLTHKHNDCIHMPSLTYGSIAVTNLNQPFVYAKLLSITLLCFQRRRLLKQT